PRAVGEAPAVDVTATRRGQLGPRRRPAAGAAPPRSARVREPAEGTRVAGSDRMNRARHAALGTLLALAACGRSDDGATQASSRSSSAATTAAASSSSSGGASSASGTGGGASSSASSASAGGAGGGPDGSVKAIVAVGYGGLRVVSRDGGLTWGDRAAFAAD